MLPLIWSPLLRQVALLPLLKMHFLHDRIIIPLTAPIVGEPWREGGENLDTSIPLEPITLANE